MKKLLALGLIFFSFLFQSCSSYKYIDYDYVKADEYKKIRVVMIDGTKYDGSFVKKDEQNLYISTRDGKTLKIPQKGIYEVQVQKLSYLKTSVLISLPIVGIYALILIVDYIKDF
ncbi:MAG: hypothetical protein VX027_04340 [Bacteroidota bacterium]|nr:hypothetical protein [Bacteroidota bacterium]